VNDHQRAAGSKHRAAGHRQSLLAGGVLLGAAASGALAAAALVGAGTANATCASISGVSAGTGCTSSATSFAIGLGPGTVASANGLFTGAIANGATKTGTDVTIAQSTGAFSLAYAGGKNTQSYTQGNLALAIAQGDGLSSFAGQTPGDNGNVAINVAQGETNPGFNNVVASGQGNIAANLGGTTTPTRAVLVQAYGTGNAAFNLAGNGSWVSAGNSVIGGAVNETGIPGGTASTAGLAFNARGDNNTVSAVGPLAVAGGIGQNNQNGANRILQVGPGLNINHNTFP
jgi:hypothetical protein